MLSSAGDDSVFGFVNDIGFAQHEKRVGTPEVADIEGLVVGIEQQYVSDGHFFSLWFLSIWAEKGAHGHATMNPGQGRLTIRILSYPSMFGANTPS